ncbi:uncharacterized protein [Periplaneta americana]|uniref:uncharacterized protein isoform X4 n=1 Tax=Periplaneta americana TaxID=6978 RepID=UPI0037E91890
MAMNRPFVFIFAIVFVMAIFAADRILVEGYCTRPMCKGSCRSRKHLTGRCQSTPENILDNNGHESSLCLHLCHLNCDDDICR